MFHPRLAAVAPLLRSAKLQTRPLTLISICQASTPSWHSHKVGGYHTSITNEPAQDRRGASRLRSGEGSRLLPALLVSPALASCAQSPSVTGKSELIVLEINARRPCSRGRSIQLTR